MKRNKLFDVLFKVPYLYAHSFDSGISRFYHFYYLSFRMGKLPVIYSASRQMEPPSKDFVSLEMTQLEIIINRIRISPSNLKMQSTSAGIKTTKIKNEDFKIGDYHDEIRFYFGEQTLQDIIDRLNGKIDHLNLLPDPLKHQIISHLPIEDVSSLSLTNKSFYQLCNSDTAWLKKFENISEELLNLGDEIGFKKLYFMNKMDLQRKLRRVRQSMTFITD